jgi:AcrR family transcriptional regulator
MVDSSTRHKLVITAERLFAAHGVNGVSLRQIRIAAGQRNESALHYHFGSREGLIRAVLLDHAPQVHAREAEMLAPLWESKDPTPGQLAEAFVVPYAELLTRGRRSRYYLQIRAYLFMSPQISTEDMHRLEGRGTENQARLLALCRTALADIPLRLVPLRVEVAQLQTMQALAFRAAEMNARRTTPNSASTEIYTASLIEMYLGAVSQPVSEWLNIQARRLKTDIHL